MNLVGADQAAKVTGLEELPGKANYFIGNDPKKWQTNVPTYAKVKYENVYPGIDLVYYGNQGKLEYDFVVAPGADPKAITLGFAAVGSAPLQIDAQGDLLVQTGDGAVQFHKPVVYQKQPSALSGQPSVGLDDRQWNRRVLDGRYVLSTNNRVQFQIPDYDKNEPLVIDPVLSYSTYLGGSGADTASGIAVDSSGNAYVTGNTLSSDFPTASPLQSANGGGGDAFVTKLNAAGNALVYSTYLGGSGADAANGIAVDSSGNAYVTGSTSSTNFPTNGPLQAANGGFSDAFVTKLNAAGNALVYSTYLGGSGVDTAYGIAVDSSGNAYVAGVTNSANFPTANPLQPASGGDYDAFVTKLNATGNALVYSTYLGGSGREQANGIAVDSSGNAYVTGRTSSTNFPTNSPLQPARGGAGCTLNTLPCANDAFVTKLNAAGNALVYSTYLGGSDNDQGLSIAVDSSGNAYVTGSTLSSDFPTASPIQPANGGGTDAFVTKLNAAGNALVYSTYLGGSGTDLAYGIAVDSSGNVYVTGGTSSTNFLTADPIQPLNGGGGDAFVTKLNTAGNARVYSTYLGGSGADTAYGIAVDSSGNAYVTGNTTSADFPTASPLQPANGGGGDAFVMQISSSSVDDDSGLANLNVSNTFTGNQTVSGTVSATSFVGGGSGLTGVNAQTAMTANGVTCIGCVGNTQLGIAYAGSASQGGPATSALLATSAAEAINALALGGVVPGNYARLDVGNAFNGNQSVTGNLSVTGSISGGGATFSGALTTAGAVLPPVGTATANNPASSNPLDFVASSFNGSAAVNQLFRWQVEGNGSSATGTLNLLGSSGSAQPTETGLSIGPNGVINFAPGQTFSGASGITSVAAGTGLSGGGSSGTVTLNNTGVLSITAGSGITSTAGQAPTLSLNTAVTDTRYLQLTGGTLAGGVIAPSFAGNGSTLTSLNPANLSAGTAGINITGNAATATAAAIASNATALGGVMAGNYARLDIGNNFNGKQSVTGNLATTGSLTIGSGTAIKKQLAILVNPSFAAMKPSTCVSANFTLTGAADGDTIALGVPNERMQGGGILFFSAWVSAPDTVTLQECNLGSNPQKTAGSGEIRIALWQY
jgi:hypothetical protein